jgi:hypothetical protein
VYIIDIRDTVIFLSVMIDEVLKKDERRCNMSNRQKRT